MNLPLIAVVLGPFAIAWIGFEFGISWGKRQAPASSGLAPLQKFGD